MSIQQIRLTFQTNLISEPVIYRLGHKFKVITNIKRANVRQNTGWVILELEGDNKEIDASLEWIKSVGVDVDVIK